MFFHQAQKQMVASAKVVRGPDWKWREQDGQKEGIVNGPINNGNSEFMIVLYHTL